MTAAVLAFTGVALCAVTWSSALQAVLVPRQRPPRAARWTIRLAAGPLTAIAQRLGQEHREFVMTMCGPLSLFAMFGAWLVGLFASSALLSAAVADPGDLTPARILRFGYGGTGDAVDMIALLTVVSGIVLIGLFMVYLSQIAGAYDRRERFTARLAAQAARPADAERILATYVRPDSRELDSMFAQWTGWLADIRRTHISHPVLGYLRPGNELCWLQAAVVVMDTAALVEAVAPSWAEPHARALLKTGSDCFKRLCSGLGIALAHPSVSLQGREQVGFEDTVRLATSTGLPAERSSPDAWQVFQQWRTQYAPCASAITSKLLYNVPVSYSDDAMAPDLDIRIPTRSRRSRQ